MSETTATVMQVIGIAPAGALGTLACEGVEPGTRAVVVPAGAFDALVSETPASVFEGPEAEARTRDLAWLTPRAQRHERALREARRRAPVLPVGFGSVFSGAEALAAALAEEADAIAAFFEETGEAEEWSIKVWADRRRAIARAQERLDREASGALGGEGVAYLLSRRRAEEAARLVEDRAIELCDGMIEGLDDVALDAVERRAIDPDPEGDRWLLAHVALLVHPDDAAAFDGRLDALAEPFEREGMTLELTGPWPPYSFCPRLGGDDEGGASVA